LVKPESHNLLKSICDRERVSMAVIGTINGEGRIVLVDSLAIEKCSSSGAFPPPAVDLELEKVLSDMPQKSFEFCRVVHAREPLDIALGITMMDSLKRVLRLSSVCSKQCCILIFDELHLLMQLMTRLCFLVSSY
jgi:phosphoribosylformylglycinamidine synthase